MVPGLFPRIRDIHSVLMPSEGSSYPYGSDPKPISCRMESLGKGFAEGLEFRVESANSKSSRRE